MKPVTFLPTVAKSAFYKIIISIILIFQVQFAFSQFECDFPPTWDSAYYTSVNPMLITIDDISSVSINGIGVNECDYIGAFYMDDIGGMKCAGAEYFQNNTGVIFPVWADDPDTPEKDGFAYGDPLVFKLFSWSCAGGKTIDVVSVEATANYPLIWYPLGFILVNRITCQTSFECQLSNSEPGERTVPQTETNNWLNYTCRLKQQSVHDLHRQMGESLIAVKEKDGSKIYWPEKRIFTLDKMNYGGEYLINVSGNSRVD
nr:hypothetical protein [Bacteroidota bacterium]